MKKFILLGLAALFMFITTGCAKYSYNIEIDKKENVKLSETFALNLASLRSLDPNIDKTINDSLDESKSEYESKGYKVVPYEENDFKGITASKDFKLKNIKSSDLPEGYTSKDNMPVKINKGFFKTTYLIDLTYDIKNANSKMEGSNNNNSMYSDNSSTYSDFNTNSSDNDIVSKKKYIDEKTGDTVEKIKYKDGSTSTSRYNEKAMNSFNQSMGNMLNNMPGMVPTADLTIKIPYKATKNNATKVINDNEYQWNLGGEDPVTIELQYEKINWAGIISLIILIIVLIFAAINYQKYLNNSNW